MKAYPLLMCGPMMRAYFAGRKTITQRIVTPQRERTIGKGKAGDQVWFRETWCKSCDFYGVGVVRYAADGSARFALAGDEGEGDWCDIGGKADPSQCMPVKRWTPSIHMPRWACRAQTVLTADVERRRLHEITDADAIKEGFEVGHPAGPRHWYQGLWDSINGPGSWAKNPEVFVIRFEQANGARATS